MRSVERAKSVARERALKVALDAEKNAQDFYRQLVGRTEDGELRRLYIELSTMEDGHVTYLQGMLAASTVGRRSRSKLKGEMQSAADFAAFGWLGKRQEYARSLPASHVLRVGK